MTTFSAPRPRLPLPPPALSILNQWWGCSPAPLVALDRERWWQSHRSVVSVLQSSHHLQSSNRPCQLRMIKIKLVLVTSYTTVLLTATALSNTW